MRIRLIARLAILQQYPTVESFLRKAYIPVLLNGYIDDTRVRNQDFYAPHFAIHHYDIAFKSK